MRWVRGKLARPYALFVHHSGQKHERGGSSVSFPIFTNRPRITSSCTRERAVQARFSVLTRLGDVITSGLPLSAHDQQTLCDISLVIWRFTSASPSQRRFSELAVFDARLYIRVRRIDEPA